VAERAWFGLRTASIFAVCGNQTAKGFITVILRFCPPRPLTLVVRDIPAVAVGYWGGPKGQVQRGEDQEGEALRGKTHLQVGN
jgi:hypothetical protein